MSVVYIVLGSSQVKTSDSVDLEVIKKTKTLLGESKWKKLKFCMSTLCGMLCMIRGGGLVCLVGVVFISEIVMRCKVI